MFATKRGLDPVVDDRSRVLILGTLPGDKSLRLQQYYCEPRNQFWRLISEVFGASPGRSYSERLELLASCGVGLWDVLESAERAGSSDSAIINPRPNDFADFFANFPALRRIAFNGAKAETLWRRHVAVRTDGPHESVATVRLPSSSGSPGRYVLPFEKKVVRWKARLR